MATNKITQLIYKLDRAPLVIREVLEEEQETWVQFEPALHLVNDCNLIWKPSRPKVADLEHNSLTMFNRYPCGVFATKDALCREIRKLKNIHGGVFDFTPKTFILPNEYNKFVDAFTAEQREHAMARYQEEQENMAENKPKRRGIWICKPSDLSRGRKIFLLRSLKDLSYDCQMIAQRYIERPFLIGGYKWDLRIYVLMVGGVDLRFYLFKEGLVRFSTEKYTLGSFSNKFMHLTNSSINKYSPALHTVKNIVGSGAKWTFAALNKHLRENGVDDLSLWIRIRNVLILTLVGILTQVPSYNNCFELLGLDILVDQNMKPWLLEINASPALTIDGTVDEQIKPKLIKDMLSIVKSQLTKKPTTNTAWKTRPPSAGVSRGISSNFSSGSTHVNVSPFSTRSRGGDTNASTRRSSLASREDRRWLPPAPTHSSSSKIWGNSRQSAMSMTHSSGSREIGAYSKYEKKMSERVLKEGQPSAKEIDKFLSYLMDEKNSMTSFEKLLKHKIKNDYDRQMKEVVGKRRLMQAQLSGPLRGLPLVRPVIGVEEAKGFQITRIPSRKKQTIRGKRQAQKRAISTERSTLQGTMLNAVNQALSNHTRKGLKRSQSERRFLGKASDSLIEESVTSQFELPFMLPTVGDFQQIFPFNKNSESLTGKIIRENTLHQSRTLSIPSNMKQLIREIKMLEVTLLNKVKAKQQIRFLDF